MVNGVEFVTSLLQGERGHIFLKKYDQGGGGDVISVVTSLMDNPLLKVTQKIEVSIF